MDQALPPELRHTQQFLVQQDRHDARKTMSNAFNVQEECVSRRAEGVVK